MNRTFTSLPDTLPYPPELRAELSSIHSKIVSHVSNCYNGTYKQRKQAINAMNTVSYHFVCKDRGWISGWDESFINDTSNNVDDDICKSVLGDLYLSDKIINWDINVVASVPTTNEHSEAVSDNTSSETILVKPTDKRDLYIQPPVVPRLDYKSVWMRKQLGDTVYAIYSSLPKVPTKQCEISCTTDISSMSDRNLLDLYPNVVIHTRSDIMYSDSKFKSYENIGIVFPIEGFSELQVLDNIIKYPHIYKLTRLVDGEFKSFYSSIELDGQLYRISDVWNDLPDSKVIPYKLDFVKEYIVRRYLLERDILHIEHKYPIFGSLDPFLTLFMPASEYVRYGYYDSLELAKRCVESRISYKRSRNPVIRRIENE